MKQLPDAVQAYQQTPVFTQDTMPEALSNRHTTKAGSWAKIWVIAGQLRYRILGESEEEHVLKPGRPGVIEPQVPHCVEPLGTVEFYVEFYRA